MVSFAQLDLIDPLQRALAREGYETPTPIQERCIPPLLKGRDVLGCAQTGTGKTAAFALPVLQSLVGNPRKGARVIRALVLSPTRELAAQIEESFAAYGRFTDVKHTVIFGGVKQGPQVTKLKRGLDVLVATPGRLLDLIDQGYVNLSKVEFFILDEADRMLDMGFIHDIRKVLKLLPKRRQNLLFSATMPREIVSLASGFLNDPVRVDVAPQSTTVEAIEQTVMFVEKANKRRLLIDLLADSAIERTIVFTRTKHGANRVVKYLDHAGIRGAAIHGNKSQGARTRALAGFKDGDVRVLVATDIASRGLDVDGVSHVFNFDLPNEPESYVHRIGRTGRAGRDGIAISFCDDSEGAYLRDVEKLTGVKLQIERGHKYHDESLIPSTNPPRPKMAPRGRGGRGRPRGRSGPRDRSGPTGSGRPRRRRRR